MTGYSLKIVDNGHYPLETITAIQDLNTQKRNWTTDSVKTMIEPIYTVGEFPTYNPNTKTKRVPSILKSKTFEKIMSLIVEDGIRYIETSIGGCNIKFYTRNPEHYMYQYYLEFSEDSPIFIF